MEYYMDEQGQTDPSRGELERRAEQSPSPGAAAAPSPGPSSSSKTEQKPQRNNQPKLYFKKFNRNKVAIIQKEALELYPLNPALTPGSLGLIFCSLAFQTLWKNAGLPPCKAPGQIVAKHCCPELSQGLERLSPLMPGLTRLVLNRA